MGELHFVVSVRAIRQGFNDSLLQIGGKVIVCGGQPLSSRLSCLLLEANSPPAAGGQINLLDPTSGSINIQQPQSFRVAATRRSSIATQRRFCSGPGSRS